VNIHIYICTYMRMSYIRVYIHVYVIYICHYAYTHMYKRTYVCQMRHAAAVGQGKMTSTLINMQRGACTTEQELQCNMDQLKTLVTSYFAVTFGSVAASTLQADILNTHHTHTHTHTHTYTHTRVYVYIHTHTHPHPHTRVCVG
jgi:hypothetical protein